MHSVCIWILITMAYWIQLKLAKATKQNAQRIYRLPMNTIDRAYFVPFCHRRSCLHTVRKLLCANVQSDSKFGPCIGGKSNERTNRHRVRLFSISQADSHQIHRYAVVYCFWLLHWSVYKWTKLTRMHEYCVQVICVTLFENGEMKNVK